ncbi:MAG: DUF4267 domain-containing protein [Candidatus Velthaea sp.]
MAISQWMTLVLAAAIAFFGLRAAFDPRGAALAFGVPIPEGTVPTPFLEVKANRDVVLGILLVVLATAGRSGLAYALFAGAIAPAADAWNVSRHGKLSATTVHLATVAYMIVAGAFAVLGH